LLRKRQKNLGVHFFAAPYTYDRTSLPQRIAKPCWHDC